MRSGALTGPYAGTGATASGETLVEAFDPASASLFASRRGVLLAEGVSRRIALAPATELTGRIAELLDGDDGAALALGAIPFDPSGRGYLLRPQSLRRGTPLAAGRRPVVRPPGGVAVESPAHPTTAVPAPADYAGAVDRAVTALRAGTVDKVVLARALDVHVGAELDLAAIVHRLADRDPAAFTFALDVGEDPDRPARTLVGASPELLVARTGELVHAHPLAGSAPRAADPAQDARRRMQLLASEKDRHEHAVVVDSIAACLRPLCEELVVPAEPSAVATSTMWHLGTKLRGRLRDPALTSLDLAFAVHPTPAVCGTPSHVARQLIATLEPFERELYAGAVGWQDASGDGEWAVTIRCGVAQGEAVRLYAGAGIVAGSDAASELDETTAKLQTLWTALDLTRTLA